MAQQAPAQGPFRFDELAGAAGRLAQARRFRARDGSERLYRRYGHGAPLDLLLIHGSSASSDYLSLLAAAVADAGAANVYTPDLRGHGAAPERRGDIDTIDQLEDDLADLVEVARRENPRGKLVIGGHSSGAGLAIRFAGSRYAALADGYLLLAPFLRHDAPTTRPGAGGWARPRIARIVALTLLNRLGITALNGAGVLDFAIPEAGRTGTETPGYSYRLMTGFAPRDYRRDLAAMDRPALVLVGSEDEAFLPERFAPLFAQHAPHARVEIVPGARHLGLAVEPAAFARVIDWLDQLRA